jgi:ubiquinone/menaquinone biosynthesis C-methylase UbiE
MEQTATGNVERWQVDTTAAEVYEEMFVPALFREAAESLVGLAGIDSGHRVLDVGCGTGIVARLARERVGSTGQVAGLDLNDGMLAVAARIAPELEWRQGDAASLPFPDGTFDVVVSQFAIMFFPDQARALGEMVRVARPAGRVLVSFFDRLDRNPAFETLSALAEDRFGPEVASVLRSPFALGDPGPVLADFRDAGGRDSEVQTVPVTARFPSVRSWLYMEAKGSPIGARLDDDALARFLDELEPRFAHLADADGRTRIDLSAHIMTGAVA